MASITSQPNGRRLIQFVARDGGRPTLRLGKMPLRQAEAIKLRVEELLNADVTGTPPSRETAQWLATVNGSLRDKLAAVGLAEPISRTTLGAFIDDYAVTRKDVKGSTQLVYQRVRKHLVDFFGEDKPLHK